MMNLSAKFVEKEANNRGVSRYRKRWGDQNREKLSRNGYMDVQY